MHWSRKYAIVGGSILAIAAGGTGAALATGHGGSDHPGERQGEGGGNGSDRQDNGDRTRSGPRAQRAVAAALAITGGGTANAVERDSENGATWEVEVAKTDGTTVDVRLDRNFNLVVIEADSEGTSDTQPGEGQHGDGQHGDGQHGGGEHHNG
jgi:hypothetical protein